MNARRQEMPHNPAAEMALLGAMMLDREKLAAVRRLVHPQDFFNPVNTRVCEAVYGLYDNDKAADLITVAESVKGEIKDAYAKLAAMVEACATAENAKHYADLVVCASGRRGIIAACQKAIKAAMEPGADAEGLTGFNSDILKIVNEGVREAGSQRKSIYMADIVPAVMEQINRERKTENDTKLYTGLSDLDAITAGLHKQEVTIVGARPGVGKTMFALQLARVLGAKGNKCLIISREMPSESLVKRLMSSISMIDGQIIRSPKRLTEEDWGGIARAGAKIMAGGVMIDDMAATVQAVRARCRELHGKGGLDALFVDYLTLMRTDKKTESRRLEVEDISWRLKEIAKEFDIPVIVLAQLSRAPSVNDREPVLSDLRETGAIEQDADNVILLHVPPDTKEGAVMIDIKVIVAKQRNGPAGVLMLKQDKRTHRFLIATSHYAPPAPAMHTGGAGSSGSWRQY